MSPVLQPILLEVLAHMPTDLFHCSHCERLFDAADIGAPVHQEIRATYPPEMMEEAARLATWLQGLSVRYGDLVHVRVVDPQSLEGFVKSLRHRIGRYPAFVIDHHTKYIRWEPAVLDHLLDERIAQSTCCDQGQGTTQPAWKYIRDKLCHIAHVASEIVYGMTTFEWVRDMRRERGEVERLFVLVTFGDIVGIPILPPYYTLRLLPYVVPVLNRWKRSLLRERDWTDLVELIDGIG